MKNHILTMLAVFFGINIGNAQEFNVEDITKLTDAKEVFSMYKSPCFGMCPEYKITVYDNLTVLFEGKSNTKKKGKHYKIITKHEYRKIRRAFRKGDFFSAPDNYPSNIADDVNVRLTWNKKNKSKTVKGKSDRPEKIINIQRVMEKLADSNDWVAMRTTKERPGPSSVITNEIIVQLRPDVDMMQWLESYSKYGMKLNRKMVPNMGNMLVEWTAKVAPKAMLMEIKKDKRVISAQFNRPVKNRNNTTTPRQGKNE